MQSAVSTKSSLLSKGLLTLMPLFYLDPSSSQLESETNATFSEAEDGSRRG